MAGSERRAAPKQLIKVVVIGAGAREHALVRALLRGDGAHLQQLDQRPLPPREVVAIPGNPGIAREARCVPSASEVTALAAAAIAEQPDLVVVGPEAPLAAGLADLLHAANIPCFGPSAAAARIESSKSFAKEIMRAAGVPTAEAHAFDAPAPAREYALSQQGCVVKLDGLAAGKGVIVCDTGAQAAAAVDELWLLGTSQQQHGGEGPRLLVEERLSGPEISVIALCDGEALLLLPPARDHKRLLEGDRGPNTGGMGAVSPPREATPALLEEVLRTILAPTVRELGRRGTPFRGALFAGLMLTPRGPRVLEFNCRLGDPEAQAILMRLRSDLLPLLSACAHGTLRGQTLALDPRACVAVVQAAHGYPAAPRSGDPIVGLDAAQSDELAIFHAGTREVGGQIVTAGGRVLTLCALGAGAREARARAYALAEQVRFEGRQMRRDIAAADE